jgi:hypothetical protein
VKKVTAGKWHSGGVPKEIMDLHGEMVLLINYSAINYTG